MTFLSTFTPTPLLRRSAVAVALAALCASASALPSFTFNPAGSGLAGTTFTADNILISDYATVRFGAGDSFTETGFLSVSGAQLGGLTLVPQGLNSAYGLYIKFTGSGNTGIGNPGLVGTSGTFASLSYTLFGYNGTASFGFDAANNPTKNPTNDVTLATGNLVSGTVSTSPAGGGDFTPSAAARLTFAVAANAAPFFASPMPFFNGALSSFTNTVSQVTRFERGFSISQGGGSFNFVAAPIPEPETYALMLGGLFAVGFVARRRRA